MSKPRVVIVDEEDNIIDYKMREELSATDAGKIYRVSGLWLTNSKGDILLAQRALGKRHDPGLWGPAAAGTIEEGDTYDSNMAKEAMEELGLTDIELKKGPKRRVSGKHNYFCQWYTVVIDKPASDFVIQKEEVKQVRWFTREELAHELKEHPDLYLDMGWALEEL